MEARGFVNLASIVGKPLAKRQKMSGHKVQDRYISFNPNLCGSVGGEPVKVSCLLNRTVVCYPTSQERLHLDQREIRAVRIDLVMVDLASSEVIKRLNQLSQERAQTTRRSPVVFKPRRPRSSFREHPNGSTVPAAELDVPKMEVLLPVVLPDQVKANGKKETDPSKQVRSLVRQVEKNLRLNPSQPELALQVSRTIRRMKRALQS